VVNETDVPPEGIAPSTGFAGLLYLTLMADVGQVGTLYRREPLFINLL
jgi:hypothetical protein